MAGHLLQDNFQWAIHCLQPVKDEIEAAMSPSAISEDGGDSRSIVSTEQESVFDNSAATAESVSDFEGGAANPAGVPPPQGPTWQQTMRELMDLLEFIAPRVSTERLHKLFLNARLPITPGELVFDRMNRWSLKPCQITRDMHTYQDDHRCIRCHTQLCEDCRHSLLTYCKHYASSNSAAIAGKLRHDSIAALRVTSYCTSPICPIKRPTSPEPRCVCMETLVRATKADEKEFDGFYHCNMCLADVIGALFYVDNIRILTFLTEEGDEYLGQYACACGTHVGTVELYCKICLGICMPYTLNAFDTISRPGLMNQVVLKSPFLVNGGQEGSEGWNNADCFWFLSDRPDGDE